MSQIDLWYATRATGIVALVLLSATLFLGVMVAGRAPSARPQFARADLHRHLSVVTLVFLAVHILTSVLDPYVHVGWASVLVPFTSGYDPTWVALGTVSVDLMVAVAISSALRRHIPARLWRSVHWLTYLSWPVAASHALGMGTDVKFGWLPALVGTCTLALVGAALWRMVGAARARALRPAAAMEPRRSLRAGRGLTGPAGTATARAFSPAPLEDAA